MGVIDEVISVLESQPWAVQRRFAVRRDGPRATLHRGGMQAGLREVGDGTVEVAYAHAPHEVTRVRVGPESAAQLLLAVRRRERLVRVEVPDDEPGAVPDGPGT